MRRREYSYYVIVHPRPAIKHIKAKMADVMKNRGLKGAEVGVAEGIHAKNILKTLRMDPLWLIDPYDTYYYKGALQDSSAYFEIAKHRLRDFEHKIFWVRSPETVLPIATENQFDFIYIDANHEYPAVVEDLTRYYPLIREGGVLCGHDYNLYGVKRAVNEFSAANNLELETAHLDWWIDV